MKQKILCIFLYWYASSMTSLPTARLIFPKKGLFRNYREIIGNSSRLHSTSEWWSFKCLWVLTLLEPKLVHTSKQGVIVRSPNHLLWECSSVPKHRINTPFKTEIIYLVLLFAATLIIEWKYFCYVYHQIMGPEILKFRICFRKKKICSLKESRLLNLK